MGNIRHFRELEVYRMAMEAAVEIFEIQKYEHILGKLVTMVSHPDQWTIRTIREDEANYA